ncbi:hypothetical protein [Gilvimarinus algae]|uniref:DUF2946 domain-containing protein n=1 Tax=Gilvimarinus algae TaxID=3058037 RepID=A0ABT8TKB6_9GAMM|nr:hypothetical protein [Gilvimarinus sp. SDUM040014]MDO3384040.1 hypothetical protein [Gilvimarinus sp. SDUM040014]
MLRALIVVLALTVVAQATLAAADAHILHQVSGELEHHHQVSPHDGPSEDGGADHGCQHCCHGHSVKGVSAVGLVFVLHHGKPLSAITADHTGLSIAPDSPPPIS